MKSLRKLFAVCALSTLGVAGQAHALVQGYNVDLQLGLDSITGGGVSSSSVGYGARLGYHLDPNVELGVNFTIANTTVTTNNVAASNSLGLLLADMSYHFNNEFNPLYVGVRLGVGFKSKSDSTVNATPSSANFAYGLVGGYDAPVGNNFSIGPKVAYTILTPANGTSTSDFQAHAVFKYFF